MVVHSTRPEDARSSKTTRTSTAAWPIWLLILAILASPIWLNAWRVVTWWNASAISALHRELRIEIEVYRDEHGRYPEKLSDLVIRFDDLDGASPRLLRCFDYHASPTHYELILTCRLP